MTPTIYGILLKMTAISLFTVMMAIVKETSAEVPTGQQMFFRAFFALLIIVGWLASMGQFPNGLHTKRLGRHLTRGLVGGSAMGLRFTALGILTFPDVTALGFTTPLVLTVFAAVMLGETVRAFRLTTVTVGFVGVLIVLWPNLSFDAGNGKMWGIAAILGSASLAALAQVHVRRLVDTENTTTIVFYFSLLITVLSLCTLPFGWVWPSTSATMLLIGAGVIGGIGQICLTSCYRFAPASVVAPFDYTSMLLAIAIGIFWFSEIPTLWTLAGSLVIIASGAVIVWRERQLGKQA